MGTIVFQIHGQERLISPGSGREFAIAFSINGKRYFGLGYGDPSRLNPEGADFWEYDPATDEWTQKHDVPF
ncbi:MAG: hypothetical protein ACTHOB_02305, partial [Ginsengibacter sp.]